MARVVVGMLAVLAAQDTGTLVSVDAHGDAQVHGPVAAHIQVDRQPVHLPNAPAPHAQTPRVITSRGDVEPRGVWRTIALSSLSVAAVCVIWLLASQRANSAEQQLLEVAGPACSTGELGDEDHPSIEIMQARLALALEENAKLKSILGKNPQVGFQNFLPRLAVLSMLLLLQSVSSVVLEDFHHVLIQHPEIIYFITMLTGAGGIAGGQTVVGVVRDLAVGRVNFRALA